MVVDRPARSSNEEPRRTVDVGRGMERVSEPYTPPGGIGLSF